MKNTIKLLLIILLTTFILDKASYFLLNTLSDKVMSGQAIGKINQYLQIKDSLDFIVYGSSRANHHLDVSQFSTSGFNMGTDGTTIGFSSTLIKLLPKKTKQSVIWHIDANKVFDTTYTGEDIKALNTKYHRNIIIKEEINKAKKKNSLQSFYWCIDYNGKVLGILKNLFSPGYDYKTYNGYDPIQVSDSQKEVFKKTLKQVKDEVCQDIYSVNPLVKNYLEEVKLFCKQNNKTLIVITSPTYKPKCIEKYIRLKEVMKDMDIVYYDYSNFFVENNSFDYWKDYTHLSSKGATIFSKKLKETLKKDMLLRSEY